MRTALFVCLLLCATAAFCQSGATIPNEIVPIQIFGHPEHASHMDMAKPQVVLQDSSFYHEKGDRPLWEFPAMHRTEISLGEVARRVRRQQETARKSETVWVN
jgi:hypothetical protein